jgi:hypothetical protein
MVLVCFRFPLCLGCNFVIVGDTYFVYWLGGSCLFIGSWVAGSVCLARVYTFEPWGSISSCSCFIIGLVLVVFFCLIWPCRVGVQRQWLELFFFLFFWIIISFWGALWCSAPAPTSQHAAVLFSLSSEVNICYSVRFFWCFSADMKENSCMQNCSRITCVIAISIVFLLE